MTAAEALNTFGRWLVPLLGQLSLELAVLAGVVFLLLHALRVRSPRLRSGFWAVVLAKPVVSLLVASPVSLYWFLQTEEPAAFPAPRARAVAVAPPPLAAIPLDAGPPRALYRPAPPPSPLWWEQLDAYGTSAALWGLVSSTLALRLLCGLAFVAFLRRTAAPQRAGPLADAARVAAGALGLRRPIAVALSAATWGPVLAGVVRPAVLLPAGLAGQLSEDQLRLVMAHESAHARHRDNLFLLVRRLAEVLLFFHPVVWLSGWALGREVESACDEAVVTAFGGARAAYAGALVEVASLTRNGRVAPVHRLLLNTFAASETSFGQRVRRVLDSRRNPMPYGLATAALVALVAVGAVGLPRAASRSGQQAATNEGGKAVAGAGAARAPGKPSTGAEATADATENTTGEADMDSMGKQVDGEQAGAAGAGRVGSALAGGVTTPGGASMLQGLEYPQRIASELACIEGALRYLGAEVSAPWLCGATGHAFAIAMAPGVHIASPYAWQKTVYDLAPNLGFRLTGIKMARRDAGAEYPARQRQAYDLVRDAIDRGLPCYADRVCWVPDYALITGYDEVGYYYTHRAVTGGPMPWQKLGTEDIEVLDVWRVEPCAARPDDEVVRAALQTVLQRAATPRGWALEDWQEQVSGPAAFDLWADEVESGEALLDSHTYNAHFWAEYREMAVEFLQEAKERLPGRCDPAFDAAIDQYRMVADRLAAVRDRFPFRDNANWRDKLQDSQTARLLREAGAAERRSLRALAGVLAAMGGTPPQAFPEGSATAMGYGRQADTDSAESGAGGQQQEVKAGRRVLEGVPGTASSAMELVVPEVRRRTWVEGFAAPGGLRPLMQVIGDPSGFTEEGDWYSTEVFPLFMGVCGDAFRFVWYRQDGSRPQQADRFAVATPAEQYLPALEAAGFAGRVIFDSRLTSGLPDPAWEASRVRQEIVASIARRKWPVLLVDVPEPGWNAVITGYQGGGDTLIGWCEPGWESFGFRLEASKRRTFEDWFAGAGGVVLLTAQHDRPSEADVLRAALERAVPELRRRQARHLLAGPATYEMAARYLEDATLNGTDPETAARRDALLFPMIWDLATQRHYASGLLQHAAEVFPAAAPELAEAAQSFRGITDAIWEINRIGGGSDPGSPLPRLADPTVRQQTIQIILQCRDHDLEAADRIEAALRKLRPSYLVPLKAVDESG